MSAVANGLLFTKQDKINTI